jgi:hypothetical protein
MKFLKFRSDQPKLTQDDTMYSVKDLTSIKSEHLVKRLDSFEQGSDFFIVYEYCTVSRTKF